MNSSRSYQARFTQGMFATLVALFTSQHPSAMAENTTPLQGTSWKLISLGTSVEQSEPIRGVIITAQFSENELRASGGCNTYFAQYSESDNMLQVGSSDNTKKLCSPRTIALQERRYFAALDGSQSYQITETGLLSISYKTQTSSGVLVFTPKETSTINLTGTSWKLVGWGPPENLSEPILGVRGNITAQFSEDIVGGSGGCNGYGGNYQTSDDILLVNTLISTQAACGPEEITIQESRYFAALSGAQNYRVNEQGQLEISYQTNQESGVLIFESR